MKRKYRYALRNQDKLRAAFGEEYLQKRLLDSLKSFFSKEVDLDEWIAMSQWANPNYNVIAINDAGNANCMQLFVVIGVKFDIVKLAYLDRVKG